ncbi:putative phage tail tape measure protein [Leuconostoc phage phiLN12]|uniref:Putative phage tail tape measure protein n=1 Tax=Leuconostoc phage phiLN12 TaxID=1262517 RepID=A0A059PAG9_9CAUD|nr:tail length tape measure protein [Leuconostoc phage phiLN12]AFY98347.1 putative phage tail tape measure protein [Leuconostoc phage phiLN12]
MATSSSYLLKIGADVGSVTKSIAQINGDIRSLANQSRNLNSAFKLTGDTSILTKNISVLEKQLTATQNKSKSLKSQLASMQASKGFDVNSVKAQKLTRDIELTESQAVKLKSELASAKTGGLDQASKSTSSLTQKLGVGTVAMGSFIGAIGATVVGKAFSVITNNVQGAITRIDTLTNATRNFQNMGVKTSVVNTQMNNLKNAINGLPTSLDSAVSGVQLLTSSLNGNMPQSVSVFKALNDGILGFGGTTEQVTNSITQLSQAFSNGKIDAETWNSLIDSGLGPTLNAIAKQMGITTGALKSGLSDGSISVSQFNDALVNLDKNGGGGIASLSKIAQDSTSGIGTSIANAKTAVTRGVADMITAVNNGIKSLDITTPLGKITGIGSIISQLGTVVEQTFEAIGQAIPQAFSGLSGVISSLVGSGNQIQTLFATISTTISGVLGTMDFSALTNLAQAILPALQSGFQTFLGYVTPAIQPLLNAFVNLWNAIQPIVNVIASSLMPVFQILGAFLGGFVSGVMGALTTAFNVLAGVARVLTPVIQFVGSVIQALAPIFVTVAGFIGQLMGQFAGFNGVLGVVGKVVSSVFSGIIGFGSRLFSSLSGVFNNIANGFRIMGSGLGSVGRGISNTFSSIIGFAGRMVSGIIGAVSGVAGRIASHFSGVFGAISRAIGNVTDIGANIVNGIAQGIRGAWGAVTSAIGALTDMIPKKIRSLLGIHSPSRVMRDMVGKFIPQGIAVGMTSQDGFISSHAQKLKDQLTGSMSNISLPSIGLAGGSLSTAGTSTSTTSNQVTINVNGANPDSVVPQIKRELRRVGLSTN